jgi:hypothetical protein
MSGHNCPGDDCARCGTCRLEQKRRYVAKRQEANDA